MSMIALDTPNAPIAADVLAAPGGFFWWYVDVLDEQGDGFVVIASFGLPFLPGYAAAERRGAGQRAGERPSVNLVLYRAGRPVFYSLLEVPADEASWDPEAGRMRLGESLLECSREGDLQVLRGTLAMPLPRGAGTLRGTFRVEGPLCRHLAPATPASDTADSLHDTAGTLHNSADSLHDTADTLHNSADTLHNSAGMHDTAGTTGMPAPTSPHRWTPLIPRGTGEGRFELDGAPWLEVRGEAYHDRNASPRALHRLGIDHWIWGRATLGDDVLLWYLLWPQEGDAPRCIVLRVDAAGGTRPVEEVSVALGPPRRTLFGMRWWPELTLARGGTPWLRVRHGARVDDGPFYLRFQVEVEAEGRSGQGWGELVDPERVDLARHRPLVRMRVQRAQGPNSFWLPLFAGPAQGRIGRLLRPGRWGGAP